MKTRKLKWEEKQMYGNFKRQRSNIAHEKTCTWLRKENLKKESKSLLILQQNTAIKTYYIKAKM